MKTGRYGNKRGKKEKREGRVSTRALLPRCSLGKKTSKERRRRERRGWAEERRNNLVVP